MLDSETVQLIVPRDFVNDFEVVAENYQLRQLGEYALAKEAARNDLENAISTFSALAKERNAA